ncbi:MAG: outer membrane beta-barrel protein, partial [Endomicrobiales bacterium]
ETGEIEMSATEEDTLSRTNESVRKLVRTLIGNDRSDYQAYLRGQEFDNSFRINAGFPLLRNKLADGTGRPIDEDIIIPGRPDNRYSLAISYRRKGAPFLKSYNLLTEIEAGYLPFTGWSNYGNLHTNTYKIDYYPVSMNIQYYVPISFVVDTYVKAGAGAVYRHLIKKSLAYELNSNGNWEQHSLETSDDRIFWPCGKIGFGADISRSARIGLQVEVMYSLFLMEEANPSGLTFNAGLSYNW